MVYSFGDCELDDDRFELRRAGARVPLQPKVLKLLIFLVRERGRAVDRDELLAAVWPDTTVAEDSISRAVREARAAIGDDRHEAILTVRGRGYRFALDVTATKPPASPAAPAPRASASFVGRQTYLAALGACLEQALDGHATSAAIAGEPGMGKTRLAEEVAAIARARGARVLSTRLHETPEAPPFWPFIQLLGALAAESAGDVQAQANAAHALLESAGPSEFRAFKAVTTALESAARERPLVVVADDMHWADEGSLVLLRFVAREARDARLLVLWTYRDVVGAGDGSRARALGAALGEIGSVAIPVGPMSPDETAALVLELKGQEPSADLARAIHERSGGSPLFVRQLLETEWAARAMADARAAAASSIELQSGVRASTARYIDALSMECREVLVWAAILGKEFDFAPLATLTSKEKKTLLDLLDEAVRGRGVSKKADGRYYFVLPLIADVLYKGLPASERAARHHAAAVALESFHRGALDVHSARIAHHFYRAAPVAGTAREAFEYSVRAARNAEKAADAPSAVRQWQRALRALDFVPVSDPARIDAQLALARAHARAGDPEAARKGFLDAAMLARALSRADALADAANGYADLAEPGDARAATMLAEARAGVEAEGGEPSRGA